MKEIGIVDIGAYVPDNCIDNIDLAASFGKEEKFVRQRIGAVKLPVCNNDEETSDLAVKALTDLLEKTGLKKEEIDLLIVVSQNPDGCGLPHTSAIVQHKAGLPTSVAAFDISLGCSGFVYGLKVMQGMMAVQGVNNGILITSDPYSKIIDKEDPNTRLLFGDAATATLISNNTPRFKIGDSLFGTDGSGSSYLQNSDGKLEMNGRQIFNFAAMKVPVQIEEILRKSNLDIKEIDKVILHPGSKYIVDTISKKIGAIQQQIVFDIENTGNAVSSSIPLVLKNHLNDRNIQNMLISGFGVGLSYGSAILKRLN